MKIVETEGILMSERATASPERPCKTR